MHPDHENFGAKNSNKNVRIFFFAKIQIKMSEFFFPAKIQRLNFLTTVEN